MTDTVFTDDAARNDGGGALALEYDGFDVTITDSTFAGNTAGYTAGNGGSGGGIEWYRNDGDLVIRSSTLSGNTAAAARHAARATETAGNKEPRVRPTRVRTRQGGQVRAEAAGELTASGTILSGNSGAYEVQPVALTPTFTG